MRLPKWLVPAACVMHGLGMLGGVWFVFSTRAWPLGLVPDGAAVVVRGLVSLVWLVSGAAFVAGGWGLWQDAEWWRQALWIAAPTTLLAVALWANKDLPFGVYIGAAFAVGVIVALMRGW